MSKVIVEQTAAVEYRDVVGFPGYRVGNDGSVWSCRKRGPGKNRVGAWYKMKQTKSNDTGHLRVGLYSADGVVNYRLIHRLVLEAFVGPCPEGMECRHFPNGDPTCNAVTNLVWGTPKENAADRTPQGKERRGQDNNKTILKDEEVLEIKRQYDPKKRNQSKLARMYGVTQSAVWAIVNGKTWRHLDNVITSEDGSWHPGIYLSDFSLGAGMTTDETLILPCR